jgi:tetraprenyl-beta-curcumene synthase
MRLLRLLVGYQVLADYLDRVNERNAHLGIANGLQLHVALVQALRPNVPTEDYYRLQPNGDDNGYARTLVQTCQSTCAQLPSYECVQPFVLHAAELTRVLAINHEPCPERRDRALERWAAHAFPDDHGLAWFELSAAASGWLTVLALLALASEPQRRERDALRIYEVYMPWISILGTMLDSYSDIEEDVRHGDHSYIAHYPGGLPQACRRLAWLIAHATAQARSLPNHDRHLVLIAAMTAMYLSKQSAGSPLLQAHTRQLLDAGEPLARSLMPALKAFRKRYAQMSY